MTEELEITVRTPSAPNEVLPLGEIMRKLALATIGAIAVTREETERVVQKMTDQRELAQKDSQQFLVDLSQRLRPQQPLQRLDMSPMNGFEQFLNRLNIPSKRDIDDLSTKIAQLSARMEELQHNSDKEKR